MSIRIAINGYGRIGRQVLRAIYENNLRSEFEVVAVNASGDLATNAHLLKYDTTHGRFATSVETEGENTIIIDGEDGKVHLRPAQDVQKAYEEKVRFRARRQEQFRALRAVEPATRDGRRISLNMNAGLLVDLPQLSEAGAEAQPARAMAATSVASESGATRGVRWREELEGAFGVLCMRHCPAQQRWCSVAGVSRRDVVAIRWNHFHYYFDSCSRFTNKRLRPILPSTLKAPGRPAPSGWRRSPPAARATAWCPRRSGLHRAGRPR